jgi:hypothetical protein
MHQGFFFELIIEFCLYSYFGIDNKYIQISVVAIMLGNISSRCFMFS